MIFQGKGSWNQSFGIVGVNHACVHTCMHTCVCE
jgi:hypothetical protein